ncbi:MAG: hypothetical protein ABIW79_07695 [Gemmatimonas sp.]
MKKKSSSAIPDFSRKRPAVGGKAPAPSTDKQQVPNPRQPQKPPAMPKSGGRRGG